MGNLLLINVDELWLKGGNRPRYFKILKKHLKSIFKSIHTDVVEIKMENQRLIATSQEPFSLEIIQRLQNVPGIHSLIPAVKTESDMDSLVETTLNIMKQYEDQVITFRVNTKRVNKFFPSTSMETSGFLGHKVLEAYPQFKVLLKGAQVVLDVKIQNDYSYISHQKFMAIGGLPVSSSGHLVTLLSGGFDSPVASFLMSKRGCSQDFAFFYAYPYVGEEVKEKIIDLAKVLAKFQNGCTLHVIPFGKVQKEISKDCRESYRTLLFRKYMLEAASILAQRVGAKALLTGDSLGQVSSQTLENIAAIDSVTTLPILRPLLGMNKREIIATADKIGTHDISIIPHDDACSLFAPDAPVVKPDRKYWSYFNNNHDLRSLLEQAVEDAEVFRLSATGELLQ